MYILMWRPYELHFLVWFLLVTVQFSRTAFFFKFVFCAPVVCEICGSHTKVAEDSFRSPELLHHVIRQIVTNTLKDHHRLLDPQDKGLQSMELLGNTSNTTH